MVLEAGRNPRWGYRGVEGGLLPGGEGDSWENGPSTPEQPHTTLLSCLKTATAPRAEGLRGSDKPARNDVITLMEAGLAEHFISTGLFMWLLRPFTQQPVFLRHPSPVLRNPVPVSNPTAGRGEASVI